MKIIEKLEELHERVFTESSNFIIDTEKSLKDELKIDLYRYLKSGGNYHNDDGKVKVSYIAKVISNWQINIKDLIKENSKFRRDSTKDVKLFSKYGDAKSEKDRLERFQLEQKELKAFEKWFNKTNKSNPGAFITLAFEK